jgi:hypothetical protein
MRILLCVALVAAVPTIGCKKKAPPATPVAQQEQQPPRQNDDMTVTPGPGGGVVVGAPTIAGGGGGGGAVQAVRGAATRAVTQNDLNQIRIYIENASLASGRMPTPQETYAALQQEAPQIAQLINEGAIVLHYARTREDIWAYERKAYDQGGQVLTSQGVAYMDAATLRQRLGQ